MTEAALSAIIAFANTPAHLFQAHQGGSPQYSDLYLAALDALAQSDAWLQDHTLVQSVFSRLEAIDPLGTETCIKTRAVYHKISGHISLKLNLLLKSNTVRIRISDREVIQAPLPMLFAGSANFRVKDDEIDLSGEARRETLAHFITYLCTGETTFISDENVIELHRLANNHGLTGLSMKCLEHLLKSSDKWSNGTLAYFTHDLCAGKMDFVTDENVIVLYRLAKKLSLTNLSLKCLDHLLNSTVSGSEPPLTQEETDLRSLLNELKNNGIRISESVIGVRHVNVTGALDRQALECLTKLHQHIPVTHLILKQASDETLDRLLIFAQNNPSIVSLELGADKDFVDGHRFVDDSYLKGLAPHLPHLTSICIRTANITTIPRAISDHVTTLICDNCPFLMAIDAPCATTLSCLRCPALNSLSAPAATKLTCTHCYAMTTITAPSAIALECSHNETLTTINAPVAATLDCCFCEYLKSIYAPITKTLICKFCASLPTINAPSATTIECAYCASLTTIDSPIITELDCHGCRDLATIHTPLAKKVTCDFCPALTTINAPLAAELSCCSNPALHEISAPSAITLKCNNNPNLTTINAPLATTLECACCRALKTLNAPLVAKLDCCRCNVLTNLDARSAISINCSGCPALKTINAPFATTLNCNHTASLTAINAPLLTTLIHINCPFLRTINAPLLPTNLPASHPLLTTTVAPILVWELDRMAEVRRQNQAEGYEALCLQMLDERNQERELCHALILECEFKAKLLRNKNIRGYIDPLTEKLHDPATAEGVIGEVADFSRWAREVGGHEHLAQWLYNLKEEIRRTVEVVHTQSTNRFLLREQYAASREAQNNDLHKDQPVINLSLFLNNKGLRRDLRHLYADIGTVDLGKMRNDLCRVLSVQLPLLHPDERDHAARITRILSLIERISETKDYEIDPEGVGTRMAAVVKSICTYGTARHAARNIPYLKSLLEAIEEGAEQCQNRATDALHKSEEIYFQRKFKDNRSALYGIELMRWKRRFLEQFVRLETMPAVFGRGEGAGWDIEMIMTNSQTYNELLDLNMDIKGILYMDDIKRYLAEHGRDGQEIADPQELFKALLEKTTTDKVLDLCLSSPAIQKLHGVNAAVQETPQDVREKVGIQLAAWGKPLVERAEESKDNLDKLGDMLNGYREMDGFADLQAQFDASITNLRSVYAAGSAYDDDNEIEIIHSLQIALSNMHDAYRQRIFQDNSPGGFRDSVIKDLIEARYLVLPELDEGQLSLDYAEPSNLVVDPNAVIEATLQLNVEEWPSEFFDAQ